jgi:hypothetical protein
MHQRAWLFTLAAALPLLAGAGWLTSNLVAGNRPATSESCCTPDCCPDCYPGCCDACPPDCCAAQPATNGKTLADSKNRAKEGPYTCPLTGEELPCPECCPLNEKTSQASAKTCCPP